MTSHLVASCFGSHPGAENETAYCCRSCPFASDCRSRERVTVAALIERLQKCNPHAVVTLEAAEDAPQLLDLHSEVRLLPLRSYVAALSGF